MSKNTEYSRAWRRKLLLKAQLFDELMVDDRSRLPTLLKITGSPGPEFSRVVAYAQAHPWSLFGGEIRVTLWSGDITASIEVQDTSYARNTPPEVFGVVKAALTETTSTPVEIFDYRAHRFDEAEAKAADITRRMREAGIWTGPR